MAVKKVSDSSFAEDIKSGVVLVDFWAEWCGPCKMVSPVIEELSEEMQDVTFTKLNSDENQQTAQQFGITALPTLMVFKDGEPVDQLIGAAPKQKIKSMLMKHQ